jgi:hypothetical protein
MAMPEAAVDEDHLAASTEHEVRFAWQTLSVQSIPNSHTTDHPAKREFWSGVAGVDLSHVATALLRRMDIGHDRENTRASYFGISNTASSIAVPSCADLYCRVTLLQGSTNDTRTRNGTFVPRTSR